MTNLDNLIKLLTEEIIDCSTFDKIKFLLENISIHDISKYIKFSDLSYMRNYIYSSKKFDIILICWKAGQKTEIHDHPNYCCLLKVIDGRLLEDEYYNTNAIEYVATNILTAGSIANKKGNSIVHQIIAVENTISLHIYIPGKYKPIYFI